MADRLYPTKPEHGARHPDWFQREDKREVTDPHASCALCKLGMCAQRVNAFGNIIHGLISVLH